MVNNIEHSVSNTSEKEIWQQPEIIRWSQIMADSYRQLVGENLVDLAENPEQLAHNLFFAPFVLVSHGTQAEPIFNYANRTAMQLWSLSWDEFIATPSASVTEPDEIEARAAMLKQAAEQGYIDNYQGIRTAKTGKKFRIEGVRLWNLSDRPGKICGQAATFPRWTWL
ncbi:MAG: MEKHLA domain-containing protein [Cyanobacteria bacterium J06629_2]